MKVSDIKIGDTRLGSWNEVMNAPENWWCPIVMKFNMIVVPTMVLLEVFYY
jgi:hypothetical protein